jgi:hypothetical protein
MRLRNRDGTPVDPVPFLVVVALAFLLTFSLGPIYASAVGLSFRLGLSLSAGLFVVVSSGAYVRLVWHARPELRTEVPAADRLTRLLYAALCLALLLVLLSIPLL